MIVLVILLIAEFVIKLVMPLASGLVHTICIIVLLWSLWDLIIKPILGR